MLSQTSIPVTPAKHFNVPLLSGLANPNPPQTHTLWKVSVKVFSHDWLLPATTLPTHLVLLPVTKHRRPCSLGTAAPLQTPRAYVLTLHVRTIAQVSLYGGLIVYVQKQQPSRELPDKSWALREKQAWGKRERRCSFRSIWGSICV